MSRMPRAGGRYVTPLQTDGTFLSPEAPKGRYTLSAGTTYYYILGGADAPFLSAHVIGYTAGLVVTSITVQDCDAHELEVLDSSGVVGEWIGEDPSTAFVGVDGTGWTVTNGVVAVAGTGVGGAMFHVAETGAARTRLTVVVGGTGGSVMVSAHGKD
jgi:hypothetical protein